jgi:hypothetical protein
MERCEYKLERACEITNRHYRPVIDEDQLSITTIEHGTTLLKIHGDLNHPSRLIATEEDYDTFLEKYPLLSTYIANLLISRTPLFIGYSLEDPDFRQIWQVIGSRLGKLRRTAYTVSVGAHGVDIARFERRGVKVISLSGSTTSYGKILETLFQELRDYWLDKLIEVSTVVDEEPLIELALPRDAQTRLCYFAIPAKLHAFYQNYIFPIVERFGFTPVTAMDVLSPGDNILAKVSTLIDRATLIVADVSTSLGLSEVGMAVSRERKVLIIIEEGRVFPSEISGFPYIERSRIFEPPDSKFIDTFEEYFENISKDLEERLYEEPRRLLEKKEYRAAVISAITLLEAQTRELLMSRILENQKFRVEGPVGVSLGKERWRTPTLVEVLEVAVKYEFILPQEFTQLKEWISIRNRLVHTNEKISPQKARKIVNGVMQILQDIRNRRQ